MDHSSEGYWEWEVQALAWYRNVGWNGMEYKVELPAAISDNRNVRWNGIELSRLPASIIGVNRQSDSLIRMKCF